MAIGDAGDDFSMAAARAVLRGTASMLRFLLARSAASGSSRMRGAFDRRYERAEREIDEGWAADGPWAERAGDLPAHRTVWAADEEEAREIRAACERLNIEVGRGCTARSDGIVPLRLVANYDALPVAEGGEFDPLDAADPEVAAILERFTYEAARAQVAFNEAAEAARAAYLREARAVTFDPGVLDPSVPDPAAAMRNAHIDFAVTKWDQSGSILTDALERMGVDCAVRSFTRSGEYIPPIDREDAATGLSFDERGEPVPPHLVGADAARIQIVFDARQTPLVEKAVEELAARGVRGVTAERFPAWEANVRHARRKMANLARPGATQRVYRIAAPDAAQADALVSAARKCGVAAVAVPPSPDGTVRVYVDPSDVAACDAAIEAFAEHMDTAVQGGPLSSAAREEVRAVLADAGLAEYGRPGRPGCRRGPGAVRTGGAPAVGPEAAYGSPERDTPEVDRTRAPRMAAEVNRARLPDLAPGRAPAPRPGR